MTTNVIEVRKAAGGWVCRFVGPHAEEIVGLFGTAELPSAFGLAVPADRVLAEVQALNPGVVVKLA